ncbi:hypothetical protein LPB41_30765 [Thalassospira sp. MA62]|nr:hypothetical protein [Thalassospira sp. MA62]
MGVSVGFVIWFPVCTGQAVLGIVPGGSLLVVSGFGDLACGRSLLDQGRACHLTAHPIVYI